MLPNVKTTHSRPRRCIVRHVDFLGASTLRTVCDLSLQPRSDPCSPAAAGAEPLPRRPFRLGRV